MPSLLRELGAIFDARTKRQLLAVVFGSFVIALLDTFAIALVLPLVDLATGKGNSSSAVDFVSGIVGTTNTDSLTLILTIAMVTLFVLKDVGSMWFLWWMGGFINTERVRISARILEYYLTAPYTDMSRRSSAELMRTMDASVMQLFSYTINGLINAIAGALAVGTVLVTLLVLAPLPTVVLVVYFAGAASLYLKVIKPRSAAAGKLLSSSSMQGWRTAFAALGAIKEVNLRGSHKHFVDGYRNAQMEGAYAGRVAGLFAALPKYVLEILFILAVGLVLLLNSGTSAGSSSAVGVIALFVAAGFRLLPSVTSLVANTTSIRIGADSLEIVRRELQSAREATPPVTLPDGSPRQRLSHALQVDDVWFRYPESDVDVLRSVSLTIPKGNSLALVGTSGAGKTTLVDIILGLHRPSRGTVSVDGVDIDEHRSQWRRSVGYVPQDIYILESTLAENVAFDLPRDQIDERRLRAVLHQAQLDDLVAALPGGIDAWLGERGTRLSGGQRQRVGIARALYRDPDLLVFDEATSALDNETEHRISQTIEALAGDITVIIVAHRLSTVRNADQVAFLKGGRVEDIGTFDELRAMNAEFARLVELGSLETLDQQ